MARLIDADALKARLELDKQIREGSMYAGIMSYIIDSTPTVDAVPVVHGRWLEDEKAYPGPDLSNYVCSSCKRVGGTWIKGLKPENLFTYCPWCGAKMDGERKDT